MGCHLVFVFVGYAQIHLTDERDFSELLGGRQLRLLPNASRTDSLVGDKPKSISPGRWLS